MLHVKQVLHFEHRRRALHSNSLCKVFIPQAFPNSRHFHTVLDHGEDNKFKNELAEA